MALTIENTMKAADELLDRFSAAVGDVPHLDRGVDTSEMFFVYATVANLKPRQIIESGRALGRSTWMLGKLFPDIPILSIERDTDGPDAAEAVQRLKPLGHVACLFGDARVLVPELTLPGDVVIIDGPKELRAMKVALKTMARRKPAAVFIHDCYKGSTIRRFLESHVPSAFYSDDLRWVRKHCHLDKDVDGKLRERFMSATAAPLDRSYGGTFACLQATESFPALGDRLKLAWANAGYKLIGRRHEGEHPRVTGE